MYLLPYPPYDVVGSCFRACACTLNPCYCDGRSHRRTTFVCVCVWTEDGKSPSSPARHLLSARTWYGVRTEYGVPYTCNRHVHMYSVLYSVLGVPVPGRDEPEAFTPLGHSQRQVSSCKPTEFGVVHGYLGPTVQSSNGIIIGIP